MKPTTKTFTAHRIRQLRRKVEQAAKVPEHYSHSDWSVSPINVMDVLAVFTSLRIRSGYTLKMYQYRSGGDGNGFVYAIPIEAEFPEPMSGNYRLTDPPQPPNCLDHYMDAPTKLAWNLYRGLVLLMKVRLKHYCLRVV